MDKAFPSFKLQVYLSTIETNVMLYSRYFDQKKKSAAKEKRTQETQGSECIIFYRNFSFAVFLDEVNEIRDLNVT